MFDLGWTELLVIGVVALIVVGPKDLPKMFRTLGQMTAKARSMAREFSRAMEDAADQTGVKDVASDLRGMTNPQGMGLDEFNKMKSWNPLKDDPEDDTKRDGADGATATDATEEIDRISAEMESMRSDTGKRADTAPSEEIEAEAVPQGAQTDPKARPATGDTDKEPPASQAKHGTDTPS